MGRGHGQSTQFGGGSQQVGTVTGLEEGRLEVGEG